MCSDIVTTLPVWIFEMPTVCVEKQRQHPLLRLWGIYTNDVRNCMRMLEEFCMARY